MDKCKTRLGYNVVPPPYTKNFMPSKSDLVYPSLDDFVDVNESASESDNPQQDLKNKGVIDNGCSRHMIGNRSYITDYEEINRGFVPFGGNSKGGKITRKGKIRNEFKLTDQSHVFLQVPRKDNMYNVDLKNVFPEGGRTCLFAKATSEKSNLWHTRLRHKGKQHRASCRKPTLSFMRPFKCLVIEHLGKIRVETVPDKDYTLLPLWTQDPPFSSSLKDSPGAGYKPSKEEEKRILNIQGMKIGHTQEEGIDYNEVFAPVVRIKAITLFLAYALFKNFVVYQMDVKSSFLYGKIEEEVYVFQPLGLEDLDFPDKVYKVEKALYGLHQGSRACDYAGASLDRKSTTRGCQFLGCRDSNEKKLIQMIKIHTDNNVVDMLTKEFDLEEMAIHTRIYALPSHTKKIFGNIKMTAQAKEIANLKKRVKRLEKKRKSRSHGLKRLYKVGLSARVESYIDEESLGDEDASKQGRIFDIDANQDIYLVNVHKDEDIFSVDDQDDTLMFDAEKDLQGKESVVKEVNATSIATATTTTATTTPTISMDEITLAKALIEIKTSRRKEKGQPEMTLKKKAQISLDEELSFKLQAEEDEQERIVREKAHQIEEKRRKFFAAKRAEEKRNKPPTKSKQRSLICTYLKNMDGWKTRALKNKSFAEIQDLFNKAMKRVNMFLDTNTEVVESSKKAQEEVLKNKARLVAQGFRQQEGIDFKESFASVARIEAIRAVDPTLFIRQAGNDYHWNSLDTPMVEKSKLDKDLQGKLVDATLYHGMIGSLMYLTSSRPDIICSLLLCPYVNKYALLKSMNCLAYELYSNILRRNINPIASQQAALDNSLVALEKRLKIKRCNARIAFTKPHKEETYQVTLEALKLSPCYPTFQITAKVLKIYMHHFWNTINKIEYEDAYNFELDNKKCLVDTKVFQKILQICPRLTNQEFDDLPCISRKSTGLDRVRESRVQILWAMHNLKNVDYVSLIWKDFSLLDYKTYLDYATGKVPPKKAKKFKKHASPKLKTVSASPKEPTHKGKRVKRPAKKATPPPTIGVVIRDTPAEENSEENKRETDKLQASGSSEGADFELKVPDEPTGKPKDISDRTGEKPRVPDVSKDDSTDSEVESWGNSKEESDDVNDEHDNDDDNEDDDGGNHDGGNEDDERTDSDDDENLSFTLKDYGEKEQDEEYVYTLEKEKSDDEEKMYKEEDDDVTNDLYGDLNITQGLRDTDMTNAEQCGEDQQNASPESWFKQEEDDGRVTLTTVHDKTEGDMQSVTPPKMRVAVEYCPGALLHNITATDT
nr:retrovirus-related Pol polyprotein from transposon TNT 1-94 [Tanacetum cinerariifolium]